MAGTAVKSLDPKKSVKLFDPWENCVKLFGLDIHRKKLKLKKPGGAQQSLQSGELCKTHRIIT